MKSAIVFVGVLTALIIGLPTSGQNPAPAAPAAEAGTTYDIVVYGGSSGGVAAAVQAKRMVGSSRVDLQACKLEYSIVSPK